LGHLLAATCREVWRTHVNSDGNAVHTGQPSREGEQHDPRERRTPRSGGAGPGHDDDPPVDTDTAGDADDMPEGYQAL
jgi:hypothetical protein